MQILTDLHDLWLVMEKHRGAVLGASAKIKKHRGAPGAWRYAPLVLLAPGASVFKGALALSGAGATINWSAKIEMT